MKITKQLLAYISAICLMLSLVSCGAGGERLFSLSTGDYVYTAYGTSSGVKKVVVSDGEKDISTVIAKGKRYGDIPYNDLDGLYYGLTVTDADLDGADDIIICTDSREGKEKYRFFFGDGTGNFTEQTEFADFKAPVFGEGDGLIGNTTHKISYEIRTAAGSPDIYTETRLTEYWGRNESAKLAKISGEALIYYSENDIYCHVTYISDPEKPGTLIPDEEKWITPAHLAEYGFEPFE